MEFIGLEPRKDSILYSCSFEVENDVMKIGDLKTLKLPFSDILIGMNLFEDDDRLYDFDYKEYEIMDMYNESILFQLEGKQKFTNIPLDVHLSYNGNQYSLIFEKMGDKKLKVSRTYTANREKIKAKEFPEFRKFMTKVNEAENTHILFQ